MKYMDMQRFVPVFPLPLFILPEGKQRLRIFEAKYLSMISSLNQDNCFVVARYDKMLPFGVPDWGTLVHITDFNIDEDQILLIDVEALSLLGLVNMKYQHDGLLLAQTRPKPHWYTTPRIANPPPPLKFALQMLFDEYPQFGDLYSSRALSRIDWVSARLIEVLPIPQKEKERFIEPNSLPILVSFLNEIFEGSLKLN
ncbi:hypothetical protein M9194_13080 [Vibrio sp. S4M6]|uniref:LON peptidase substrate-binding domain-containing protein n=1 Tax=Vibrio sinus TaxID=2946865 RepID=UPI00202A341B|nr:hypothetical protein [Vibrio sinus]MCL9782361.1 hypothetical protein [Vibrio sinus]